MATKTNKQQTQRSTSKLVCCLNCVNAQLHRYGCNPILSACMAKPQQDNVRFPFEVVVASFLRKCSSWAESETENVVEQRIKAA